MSRRSRISFGIPVVLLGALLAPTTADAAPKFNYIGYAGETQVQALGTTCS